MGVTDPRYIGVRGGVSVTGNSPWASCLLQTVVLLGLDALEIRTVTYLLFSDYWDEVLA